MTAVWAPPATGRRLGSWSWLGLLCLAAWAQADNAVIRSLPANCRPGIAFVVTNRAVVQEGIGAYAVEDQPPAGWAVSQISHNGRFDGANHKVKWGPFFDDTARELTYRVTPPGDAAGVAVFEGRGSFDGLGVLITGATELTVATGAEANQAVSVLPQRFVPGGVLAVTINVVPALSVSVYSVEDQTPVGWAVSEVSHAGSFDAANGKVKWGPYFDHIARDLSYRLTAPPNATGTLTLTGVASFDGVNVAISGQRTTAAALSTVLSSLPGAFQPTVAFTVSLAAAPSADVRVYAVQDSVPAGWAVTNVIGNGAFDAANQTVKWGPFDDALPRTLAYQVVPPETAAGTYTFSGVASFDGVTTPIGGQRLTVAQRSTVVCWLPSQFLPGIAFAVTNFATPDETVAVYAVEDRPPAGWAVSAISEGGHYDAANGKVKWGPFYDHVSRALFYQVLPPVTATGVSVFSGVGSFNGRSSPVIGQREGTAVALPAANGVQRVMPEVTRGGLAVKVTNLVALAANISVYAVEDTVPDGWAVTNVSAGGRFDSANHKVKWGPFFDRTMPSLSYTITPPGESRGPAAFSGEGSFDGVSVDTAGRLSLIVLANYAPVARDDVVERELGQPLSVPVDSLLANDSDPNEDPLTLSLPQTVSAHGARLEVLDGEVVYTPLAGFEETDTFAYAVADGFGGVASATVTVTVLPPSAGLNITALYLTNGVMRIEFSGVPGQTYLVEATDSLSPPAWVLLGTKEANDIGEFALEDADIASHPSRFYRSRSP